MVVLCSDGRSNSCLMEFTDVRSVLSELSLSFFQNFYILFSSLCVHSMKGIVQWMKRILRIIAPHVESTQDSRIVYVRATHHVSMIATS